MKKFVIASLAVFSWNVGIAMTPPQTKRALPPGTVLSACDKQNINCLAVGLVGSDSSPEGDDLVGYYSKDSGATWKPSESLPLFWPDQKGFKALICSENIMDCFVVGSVYDHKNMNSFGMHMATHDGGKNWDGDFLICTYAPGAMSEFNAVACDKSGKNCAMVGDCTRFTDRPEILHVSLVTHDSGYSWYESSSKPVDQARGCSDTVNLLTKIECKDKSCDLFGIARCGDKQWETTYHSDDVGVNWQQTNSNKPLLSRKARPRKQSV